MTSVGSPSTHAEELERGERFAFGENWRNFLRVLDEDRIRLSTESLKQLLRIDSLADRTFLDIGSGSGLSSLAAWRLGANVVSFDYDPASVACTRELRRRFADESRWDVMEGSILDREWVESLGTFDVVYSWGVLHHTGRMWDAIANAMTRVKPGGLVALAIYNHQGAWSDRWTTIKRWYCAGPVRRAAITGVYVPYQVARGLVSDVVWMRNPAARYTEYRKSRGMSVLHDWRDWLGGYPFEAAKPEELFAFGRDRGFDLVNMTTCGGSVGCNELVFRSRTGDTATSGA